MKASSCRLRSYRFFAVFAAVVLLSCNERTSPPLSPGSDDTRIETYVPLNVGTEWVYGGTSGYTGIRRLYVEGTGSIGAMSGWILTVTDHKPTGEDYTYRMVWRVRDDEGWSMLAFQPEDSDSLMPAIPPMLLLSSHPQAGETHSYGQGATAARISVLGETQVTWADQTASALEVMWEDLGSTPYTEHWYLVKEIGLVRSVRSTDTPDENGHWFGEATRQ